MRYRLQASKAGDTIIQAHVYVEGYLRGHVIWNRFQGTVWGVRYSRHQVPWPERSLHGIYFAQPPGAKQKATVLDALKWVLTDPAPFSGKHYSAQALPPLHIDAY